MSVFETRLTLDELRVAALIGVERRLTGIRKARAPRYGYANESHWSNDIESAASEMLVAKARNRYWGAQSTLDREGDVGRAQVRWTARSNGCLLLHREDADDAPFVLVVGVELDMRIVGWIYAREGKRAEFWREDTGRPAFFVPQEALRR